MVRLDDVKLYANEKQTFSIPQMQKDLGIGYFDARKFVNELVDADLVILNDGVTYTYKKPKQQNNSSRPGTLEEMFKTRYARDTYEPPAQNKYNPDSPLFGIRIKENILFSAKYSVRTERSKEDGNFWLEMHFCKMFDDFKFRLKVTTDGEKVKLSDAGVWLKKREAAGKRDDKLVSEILAATGTSLENGEITYIINDPNAFDAFIAMYTAAVRILSF